MLLIITAMGIFRADAHTVVDRTKRAITMRGSSWPFRSWSLERPLPEVERVSVHKYYVGRGQYMHVVNVRFTDDASALAMSPAAYMIATLVDRIATLREFVGRPEED